MSNIVVPGVTVVSPPAVPTTADLKVSDVIEETRRHLYNGAREKLNRLNRGIDGSQTTVDLKYSVEGIGRGSKLSIDLEDILVWSDNNPNQIIADTSRGEFGSLASSHSSGAIVVIDAKFSNWEIFKAINAELDGLSSPSAGLFRMKALDIIYLPSIQGYDITGITDLQSIYSIRAKVPGQSASWPEIAEWEVLRNMATGEFASGMGLVVYDPGYSNLPMRILYKAPFTLFSSLTDLVSSSGLDSSAWELLSLGAAIRLTAGREIRRNFNEWQGDTRRASEVPPGANLGSSRELQRIYNTRLNAEHTRLISLYPERKVRYHDTPLARSWYSR